MVGKIVFCERMVVYNCRKPCEKKTFFCKTAWIWALVVQNNCWPNMGCAFGVQYRFRNRFHIKAGTGSSRSAMTQHYPSTSAAAAVWASRPSFSVSAMLLIYSLLSATALSYRKETVLQGWLVFAKSGRLELEDNIYGQYRSILNHCDVIDQQSYQIRWKTQNNGYYAVQGHSRSSRSLSIESPYATSY